MIEFGVSAHPASLWTLERVASGQPLAGVIVIRQSTQVGLAIEQIVMLLDASFKGEMSGQVLYLPFPPARNAQSNDTEIPWQKNLIYPS